MSVDLSQVKQIIELLNVLNQAPASAEQTQKLENMRYVIVRTYSAGVFAGNIESRNGREVVLKNARRIWYWEGSASLSQLAIDGTSKPQECKFPCAVDSIVLLEAIEIIDCTPKAEASIKGVPVWTA